MKLLFTGRGKSGSWKIRGEQLGAAIGATVQPQADARAIGAADMTIVVKRCPEAVLAELRRQSKPWIFDALDFYPQPDCGAWSSADAISWVRQKIAKLNPTAVIWPNARMEHDCTDGRPSFVLYHHHRPSLPLHEVHFKDSLRIGYEGSARYLGEWEAFFNRECRNRGWGFVINPESIHTCDAVVAVRAQPYSGYAQFHWKSNVKLANAQGCGVPFLGQGECGYLETSSGIELFADCQYQMFQHLDLIANGTVRAQMSQRQRERRYSVEQAAEDLRGFLNGL